ncbi:4-(cytidine 5'-diphospho)-2-C-methyl-D-erythritol kinase [uncultured Methylovirgula sp.]|uniref:4-(cytidine 5'-diphospho)-2-C-methyl-D-erythritol kinase n=1 Tax=uncultured Methylovirgula sp. TaxID=1285960 RepID=UPI00262366A1|nr:4-(cytidine 5'-diphospho)-2-C-methyl-D-erythritol kinase [uncultured Methylovirgula sp.]
MSQLTDRAPAKINLTLHVVGRRADGYHELESLVAFSRTGDQLALAPGALQLRVTGPTAQAAGDPEKNLVIKAARQLAERIAGLRLGTFTLVKTLPVAAGIGGGSSDAAAALRLLARLNDLALDDPRLFEAARATGADVPVCLAAKARMMSGIGEKLGPLLDLPPLPALIVNPRRPLETKPVFEFMRIAPGSETHFGRHPEIASGMPYDALIAALRKGRNDMEDAASVLAPIIAKVLAILTAAPGCRLARMSGSGATCFALFDNCRAVGRARKAIAEAHPDWWVKAALLN